MTGAQGDRKRTQSPGSVALKGEEEVSKEGCGVGGPSKSKGPVAGGKQERPEGEGRGRKPA